MKHAKRQIEEFFQKHSVEFAAHTPDERKDVEQRWLKAYAQRVKTATGSWIHNRFKWHGFSWGYETAIEGAPALREYQSQWLAPYVVFDEDGIWSYRCTSDTYPDFTELGADIYVAHHNMKWTMVFTHEQPHDGPFFAMQG